MMLVVCEGEQETSAEEKNKDTLDIIRRAKGQRGTKELIKSAQLFLHKGNFFPLTMVVVWGGTLIEKLSHQLAPWYHGFDWGY